jgi:RNA polymerase sigma-70 factor, ECF subfamily
VRAAEQPIRDLCAARRWADATTAALKLYGAEIFAFLRSCDDDHEEAFSIFTEDLWRGLPRFRWESTFRTWAYTLAYHAAHRLRRNPERLRAKVDIPASSDFAALREQIGTTGMLQLRARKEARIDELRARLAPDDRSLLVLRIDRSLSWLEIARICNGDEEAEHAELVRQAAALRKRFERLKQTLREMAETLDE